MELRRTPKSYENSGRVISPSITCLRRSGLLCERGAQKQRQKNRQKDPLQFFSSSMSTKTRREMQFQIQNRGGVVSSRKSIKRGRLGQDYLNYGRFCPVSFYVNKIDGAAAILL